jgi:pyruvate dehydrogenase E2 component (dihydrolipoamide acetyltransferase)
MIAVLMPQLGINEESAILTQWHVQQGEHVSIGQKLFSIETDKSSFDVEAQAEGTLAAIMAAEGDEVPVKAPVCYIGEEGGGYEPRQMSAPVQAPHPLSENAVSPRAKHLAGKLGVDLRSVNATGPDGRTIERDVLSHFVTAPSEREPGSDPRTEEGAGNAGGGSFQPLSNIRKIIARNTLHSLHTAAQLTHTASFDAARILQKQPGVTLTGVILHTAARVLRDFPALNAHLTGDVLRVFDDVHLAVAVDTERGLMAPVIFNASQKSLTELSDELKTLAEQCRSGSIPPGLLSGGSFTVSNLGQFGIESFTPILNTPQTGLLGICAIQQRVRETGGVLSAYPAMTLSLTYDHRALDGAPASRFLQTLCKALEEFSV